MPELWTPPTSTAGGNFFRSEEPTPKKIQPQYVIYPQITGTWAEGTVIRVDTYVPLVQGSSGRGHRPPLWHTVSSLENEEFELLVPFVLTIEEEEGEFLARFEEANIAMSGDTEKEAIENVLADILDTFILFSREETNLGPEPARQLSVLRRHIRSKQ